MSTAQTSYSVVNKSFHSVTGSKYVIPALRCPSKDYNNNLQRHKRTRKKSGWMLNDNWKLD
jgi:hypothetical protein